MTDPILPDSDSAPPMKRPSRAVFARLAGMMAVVAIVAGVSYWFARPLWQERPTICEEPAVVEKRDFTITPTDGEAAAPAALPLRAELVPEGVTIDPATVSADTVTLFRVRDRSRVSIQAEVESGGRAVRITPHTPLEPQTNYAWSVGPGIRDSAGGAVASQQMAFSTAPASPLALPAFEQIPLPATEELGITCLTVGPDRRLWAAVDDGRLMRFDIADDGTLSNKQEMRSLVDAHGGQPRLIGGFAFDPASTADRPIVWVTHTSFGFIHMGDWQGAVSRLSGAMLETVEPVLVNLPRSARDHILHQPVFGPDGCLYFQSGSMTSYGQPDGYWGWRREHPLAAAVLRIDPKKLPAKLPLDVKTTDEAGPYDWRAADAPVTIFAGGMRVAFDLVWHRSGYLFAPVNGSSAGGNTPAGPGAPLLWAVPDSEHDSLFRVDAGGYFGHPNPSQGTYVLNGGNPTSGPDFAEQSAYPVGTQPEKNWRPAVYDFGTHVSPNGVFAYRGEGPLNGALVVCRYNVGNDLLAINIDDKGEVSGVIANVPGWGDLQNPLDACQDAKRGNVYVSEYGKHAITLLRQKK